MTKRKNIGKKTRFEVFKRDKFKCQYCGRSVPDIVLEVDHIVPVSKGGKNTMINYVTSCFDCNRGKGGRTICDESELSKQKIELEAMAEKVDQIKMMSKWKNALIDKFKKESDELVDFWEYLLGYRYTCSGNDKVHIRAISARFSADTIIESMAIAAKTYIRDVEEISNYEWDNAIKKIGGICRNRERGI